MEDDGWALDFKYDEIMAVDDLPIVPRSNFSENLLDLLRTGAESDISIQVNDDQFKLHQFILYKRYSAQCMQL